MVTDYNRQTVVQKPSPHNKTMNKEQYRLFLILSWVLGGFMAATLFLTLKTLPLELQGYLEAV